MSGPAPVSPARGRGGTVILMYHRVRTAGANRSEGDYALPAEAFTRQLRRLAELQHPVLALDALAAGPPPGRSVALTFDDGYDTDVEVALPLLRELALPAAFFVNPAHLGRPGHLDWPQLEQLVAAGMCVGSHGLDHTLLDGLPADELERQLALSKRILETRLGRPVDTLSLPGGSGGRRALRVARQLGYRLVLGSRPGRVRGLHPGRPLPRFAMRRGHDLRWLEAVVEQRPRVLALAALRYAATRLLRAAIGSATYAGIRERSIPASGPPRPPGGRG